MILYRIHIRPGYSKSGERYSLPTTNLVAALSVLDLDAIEGVSRYIQL